MPEVTKRFPGKGSDGNRYFVVVTGPGTLIGTDDHNRPIYAFAGTFDFEIEGYSGETEYRSQGKFYLVDAGVEVALDELTWLPPP